MDVREREARPGAAARQAEPRHGALPEASGAPLAEGTTGAKLALWFLVAAVFLSGVCLVAYGALVPHEADWRALVILASLAALAERFDLSLYGDSRVSLAFVPIFAALLLSGATGLAIVVPPAVIASAVGSQRPLYKTAFNFGALMIAGEASSLVFHSFGTASDPERWPAVLGPALLAAAVNFATNSGLVASAITINTRGALRSIWDEHFRWLLPHYLVLGVLGLAIASAYATMGFWGIAVFLAPPLMMRFSLKQYLDRTTKGVLELRQAHDELQGAHSQVTAAMASLGRAYDGTLHSLVAALDARDSEVRGHSERVAELTMAVAQEMGIVPDTEEWRHLHWGALLHDVGKIAVPDEVLRKPSSLSPEEWEAMRSHAIAGYEILQSVEFLAPAAQIVRAHHERYDGAGYPRGLAGEQIPLGARVFAVADAFDAMTSDRPYRNALPPEEALAEILSNSGTQFDPAVMQAFLSVYQKRFVKANRPSARPQRLSEALTRTILETAALESVP